MRWRCRPRAALTASSAATGRRPLMAGQRSAADHFCVFVDDQHLSVAKSGPDGGPRPCNAEEGDGIRNPLQDRILDLLEPIGVAITRLLDYRPAG